MWSVGAQAVGLGALLLSALLLLPLGLLAQRRKQWFGALLGLGLALIALLLWLPSVLNTAVLLQLDEQYLQFQQGRLNSVQTGQLMEDTETYLASCGDCERLRQLHGQLQLRYVDLLWQDAQTASDAGEHETALIFWDRALQVLSAVADAPPEISFRLLAKIGKTQRLLQPHQAERPLEVEIAGSGWLGDRLLLTVRLEEGPKFPLARREITIAGWPVRLQLSSEHALLPGFDLGAAYNKGDRLLVEAVVVSAADAQLPSGSGAAVHPLAQARRRITDGRQVNLQLQQTLPEAR